MAGYTSESIRNIALVGQVGSGKTTLVEKLAESAGVIGQAGNVERGNTISDYNPLEKSFGHSLSSSVISIDHNKIHLNIIDTPGMLDFIGQSIAVFPAVETVAVVISAAAGVGTASRRMLNWAADSKLCRMIIINHIDSGVNLEGLLASIRDEFGPECLPINLPTSGGSGVVDCFFEPEGESDFRSVAAAHAEIIDQVVEMDESLMEQYLESGNEPSADSLHEPFEKAMREGHLVPICFVSGNSGAGIPELLDVFERLMPNPLEGNPRPFLIGEEGSAEPYLASPDPDMHVVAHVFKVIADPFVGKLGIFRIHQGTVKPGKQLFIGDGRKPFKVAHLLKLRGNEQDELDVGVPGDICAVAKIDEIHPDAVLHDSHEEDYLHMKPLPFPEPVFGLAVSASSRNDSQRLSDALGRLIEEDPCLSLTHEIEQNELVLRGLGELHLRMTLEQLKQRFKVEPTTRPPGIPYRETITSAAEATYRHKKQSGGAGQFGEVHLRIRPLKRGEEFRFINEVKGGTIPSQFIPAVEKGVRQAMQAGIVAGYSIQDVEVTVTDGKHHPVDSKEIAFVAAGKRAFSNAAKEAKPVLLEPVASLDLVVPSDNLGAVTGDLLSRRGELASTTSLANGDQAIRANVPLVELTDYSSRLNALTAGQGVLTMEFDHYQQAPDSLQEKLAAEWNTVEDAG
jgi:elongation factor G